MKIISANNRFSIEMSDVEWREIGAKNDWLRTAQSQQYQNECTVNFYFVEGQQNKAILNAKTMVTFDIDMDVRNWGIKSIHVLPKKIETISAVMEDYSVDDAPEQTVTIEVDASKLKTQTETGRAITTGELELWLNPDMSVNYDKSEIIVYEI